MKNITVIGAGNMGTGIAHLFAKEKFNVLILDKDEMSLENSRLVLQKELSDGLTKNIYNKKQTQDIINRIALDTDLDRVENSDLVIEAIYENYSDKVALFKLLNDICSKDTIIASNTSALSISEMSAEADVDLIGLHFFYHPVKNRLLEFIPSNNTKQETINKINSLAKIIGRVLIVSKDSPGFIVNRFFVPWLNEAVKIYGDNITNIPTIDHVAKKVFGIGIGPFKLMNITGIPIAYHSCQMLEKSFGAFYKPGIELKRIYENKELWSLDGSIEDHRCEQIKNRLLGTVFYVCNSIQEEKVGSAEDIDIGSKIGLRWNKSPYELMNENGLDEVNKMVNDIKSQYNISDSNKEHIKFVKKITYIETNIVGNIAFIKFNRPDKLNAINKQVLEQFENSFDYLNSLPSIDAIVLQGSGKSFVAGADIKQFISYIVSKDFYKIIEFTKYGHSIYNKVESSSKVTITLLDSMALGAGSELALCTDYILVTSKGYIQFPETSIGIYPGLGGTQRLSRLIGKELAKYYIFTGEKIKPNIGIQMNLYSKLINQFSYIEEIKSLIVQGKNVNKYATSKEVESLNHISEKFTDSNIERVKQIFENSVSDISDDYLRLKNKAPLAIKMANDIIDKGIDTSLINGLDLEIKYLSSIFSTKDAYEGLSSVGRKTPNFIGA